MLYIITISVLAILVYSQPPPNDKGLSSSYLFTLPNAIPCNKGDEKPEKAWKLNSAITDAFYALKRDNWCGNWDTSGDAWYTCGLPCLSTQVEQEDILIQMYKD